MSRPSPGTEGYWSEISADELEETRVAHCKKDGCDVYAGRGAGGAAHLLNTEIGSRGWLGNPYSVDEYGREEAVARYCETLLHRVDEDPDFARALVERVAGRTLGCWCRPIEDSKDDGPLCHADVIADVADRLAESARGGER